MQQTKQQSLLHNCTFPPTDLARQSEQPAALQYSGTADSRFPFRAPSAFMHKVDYSDPLDPLLRQVLPITAEENSQPGFTEDPLQENSQQPVPGLLHKYQGRALLVVTGACAIHCRYCFRRHFPYAESNPSVNKWKEAVNYLDSNRSITEVILSGGDPLTLSNQRLSDLFGLLDGITHLKRIRIHSRIPVVLPERINPEFTGLLKESRLPVIMVVHANHARELDDSVTGAIRAIRATGTQVMNQSVLLRNVNDSVKALYDLSERLFESGILPYYLHMPDPVAGTAHFSVSEQKAKRLMRELNALLPGYLVPKLVREIAGENGKIPVENSLFYRA